MPGMEVDSTPPYGWAKELPMQFRWLKLHEIFSNHVAKNLYVGLGYHFDLILHHCG